MKLIKLGLCAALALLPMACSQDRLEDLETANTKPEAGTTISFEGLTFSLEDVSQLEDDGQLRYINAGAGFELVQNSKGHIVPFPSLTDGQKAPITVAISDTDNKKHAYLHTFATYDAATKRLTLDKAEYKLIDNITGKVADDPDSIFFTAGKEYYVCAVLGGTPIKSIKPGMESEAFHFKADGSKYYPADPHTVYDFEWTRYMTSDYELRLWDVRFEYNDVLSPVQRQVGERLDMEIAYYTPWTKLDVVNVVNQNAGDHRVVTFTKKGLQFKPYGNILAIQVGNRTQQDVTIDAINITSPLSFGAYGGYVPLNVDNGTLAEGEYPVFFPGSYMTLNDMSDTNIDGRFRLSQSTVLKANQRQQYTYYIWVTDTLGPISIAYEKDGQAITQRVQIPKNGTWINQARISGFPGHGKIYFLETSI